MGDPTPVVFNLMYQRFPALAHFKVENNDWENYMFQEIITNFLQFSEDPEAALCTLRDMSAHHRLIGVELDIFKGMYKALFDSLSPSFSGPYREEMISAWNNNIQVINETIENVGI